jgi:hypothetical protein
MARLSEFASAVRALFARPAPDAFCTIATRGFLPWSRVLLESIGQRHPNGSRVLLYVPTEADEIIPRIDGVDIVLVKDLVSAEAEALLRRRYTVPEFCFALKPRLLRHLLDRGAGRAIYLDSDIDVVSPLSGALRLLRQSTIVLTPHLDEPIPEDGRLPSEVTILRAGVFNLGFIGVRNCPEARRLLEWWDARVHRWGFVAPYQGGFHGDQKWMDLAQGLFSGVGILRDKGSNVAYWNLHSRPVRQTVAGTTAGGTPLSFIHFSGFDPERPEVLSCYQDRWSLDDMPALAVLARDFARRLREAQRDAPAAPAAQPATPPSFPPLPGDEYRAGYEVLSYTRGALAGGEEVLIKVRVTNASSTPWHAGSPGVHGCILLSWHLRDEAYQVLAWDNHRTAFPAGLGPGESVVMEMGARVPAQPGVYRIELDLLQEGVAWFSARGCGTALIEAWVDRFPPAGAARPDPKPE